MSTFKQVQAIALLPGMVTIVVPGIIIYRTGTVNLGWSLTLPFNIAPLALGVLLIGLGFFLWLQTTILFVTIGKGTLAPWSQTQKLVVHGIYRHVRNPMISGVGGILLGEAILLGSIPLLYWFLFFMLLNMLHTPLLEEPGLAHRFGDDYLLYKKNVPRWIPRLRPWNAPFDEA
ncbi:MAG: isoprenylcysteine carboxylmethyltransferase family protein [Chloroflexota bacterium]